jgi:V8-like Glu-specific endopeptidase
MTAHTAGQLRAHDGATLVNPDVVLTAAECVLNDALHFEKIALTHGS